MTPSFLYLTPLMTTPCSSSSSFCSGRCRPACSLATRPSPPGRRSFASARACVRSRAPECPTPLAEAPAPPAVAARPRELCDADAGVPERDGSWPPCAWCPGSSAPLLASLPTERAADAAKALQPRAAGRTRQIASMGFGGSLAPRAPGVTTSKTGRWRARGHLIAQRERLIVRLPRTLPYTCPCGRAPMHGACSCLLAHERPSIGALAIHARRADVHTPLRLSDCLPRRAVGGCT